MYKCSDMLDVRSASYLSYRRCVDDYMAPVKVRGSVLLLVTVRLGFRDVCGQRGVGVGGVEVRMCLCVCVCVRAPVRACMYECAYVP